MWHLSHIICHFQLWFSDGLPLDVERGLFQGESSRLVIDGQGFLDLTTSPAHLTAGPETDGTPHWEIVANGIPLWVNQSDGNAACTPLHSWTDSIGLTLQVSQTGNFDIAVDVPPALVDCYDTPGHVSGKLIPLPVIQADDIELVNEMITQGIIPYQNIPLAPGKSMAEVIRLGKKLFPFTPHHFQLALCLYDWTTASFMRLVLLKIFEYTSSPATPLFALDMNSIAQAIWESNWQGYTPSDPDYMRSFLMEPASSLHDVRSQLDKVEQDLHRLSEAQNRLIAAAAYALPRTSILSTPVLFSGQMDISQLGLDHFGIEFLECPGNSGLGETPLRIPLTDTLSTYMSAGNTITTKAAWSFTERLEDALHYANGILLVLHPVGDSVVWDITAFITTLSDDPDKNEYLVTPGTRLKVISIERVMFLEEELVVITLQSIHVSTPSRPPSAPAL